MSDHPTAAFSSEAGLVEALNEIKHAIHCALTNGKIAHYMNKIDGTLRRALQNQAEGSFPDVFDRPEYQIIWYFFMQWTIFSETPGGDAKIFWHKERASVIAQRLWTPPITKALSTTTVAQATGPSVPITQSDLPQSSSVRRISPPASVARHIAVPVPAAPKPRQVVPPTENSRPPVVTVQYGTARGKVTAELLTKADRSGLLTDNGRSSNKVAPYPKAGNRLPSQIAAEARTSQAPRPAAPVPSQRPSQHHPPQKTSALPSGRAADASGPHALSADMGRMSLTPSLSKFVAFEDVNDDSDEYIPTEEEQNERKRKHQRSSEDPRPKKMRTDEPAPAEEMEADELPGEAMDTAADGRKGISRPAGIATQFVYVQPCRKCVQRAKVCRVQAGQSGDKPAAACIPCNASKVKCVGQGTQIMVKPVDDEPDVQGDVVEGLTIRPGRKGSKKKTNDTLVIVKPGASGYAEGNNVPEPKDTIHVRRPIRVESRSPTPPPKPKSAKSRPMPTIIAPENKPSTPEPSLSIVHGLLVEMLGKKFDELAERLESRFEERFSELAGRLEKGVAQGMGQLTDVLEENLEERFSLVENAILDIKTAAVSGILSGELSPDVTGNTVTQQSPLLPTVIVTAPTPRQSQDSCTADIDRDAEVSGLTEDTPAKSASVPREAEDDIADLAAPSPQAPDEDDNSNMLVHEATDPIPDVNNITVRSSLPLTIAVSARASPEALHPIGEDFDAEMLEKDSVQAQLPKLASPPPAPHPNNDSVVNTEVPSPPLLKIAPLANATLEPPLPSSHMPTTSVAPVPLSLAPARPSLAPPVLRTTSRSRSLSAAPLRPPASSSLATPDPHIGRPRARSGTFEPARRSAQLRTGSHSPLPPSRTL